MNCIKCEVELSAKEANTGKGKCVTCLLRGYQFALGKAFGENEELKNQIAYLKNQNPGKAMLMGAGEQKKVAPVESSTPKKKSTPPVVPAPKKKPPKRVAPIVRKVRKRK